MDNLIIFDFNLNTDLSNWKNVDDIVMGGLSNGNIKINENGHGEFYGNVSLENNGGFSLLRYQSTFLKLKDYTEVFLRVKGDGKKYQFRIKDVVSNKHSFVSYFVTNGEWETIKINLSEMYPTYRGRKLEIKNFSSESIAEIAFLIGNKTSENFKLEIDKIYLQ